MNSRKQSHPLGFQRATPVAASKAASRLVGEPLTGAEAVRAMTGGTLVNLSRQVEEARLNLEQSRQLYYERHQQYLDALKNAGEVPR
jgi:hypothetical protein